MKLTPLDIHHKEFRHSLRGYSEEEVDQFLDDVADEFERLFKENIDLSEKLEAAQTTLRQFQEQEQTIRNTMIAAQRSAEDIMAKARDEATSVLRDAEVKAKEIIHNALTQKQKVQNELVRIKQAEEEFRGKFRQLLEGHTRSLAEIALPEDVTVMMGETDEGVVGAVEVAAQEATAAVQQAADEAVFMQGAAAQAPAPGVPVAQTQSEPVAAGSEVAFQEGLEDQGETPAERPEAQEPSAEQPELSAEPPESGFVSGVILGESEAPDIEPDTELDVDAPEFDPSQLSSFGERDDDIEIEEID